MTQKGRPRLNKPKIDLGTAELQIKRARGATKDPLDVLLEKGIISQEQHCHGLYLRYLAKKLFGYMQVKGYDMGRIKGRDLSVDANQLELARCEKKYTQIMQQLTAQDFHKIISDICIDGHIPNFLKMHTTASAACSILERQLAELKYFKDAMQALEKIFKN